MKFKAVAGLMSVLGAIGMYTSYKLSMTWLAVRLIDVWSEDVPEHLNGLRILHISDLHGNHKDKLNLDIWKTISELEFDIVAITGDVIIRRFGEIEPHLKHIELLARRVPVFFVDGNHDEPCYRELKARLEDIGVLVFENEKKTVDVDGFGELSVIGLRDYYYLKKRKFVGVDRLVKQNQGFNLLLSHQPQIIDRIGHMRIGLILSGHTHGGQVRLPFLPTLYAPAQGLFPKYSDGLMRIGRNILYISKGIGTTYFPIRLFNRPEIAILTLKREQGDK